MGKKKKHFYAVRRGRQTGIFRDWENVCPLVHGYSRPEYKGFGGYHAAHAYLNGSPAAGSGPARKYFAIQRGRQTGVFHCTWPEVQHLVIGYRAAVYKGFGDPVAAANFCNGSGYDFGQGHVTYVAYDADGDNDSSCGYDSSGGSGYAGSGTCSPDPGYTLAPASTYSAFPPYSPTGNCSPAGNYSPTGNYSPAGNYNSVDGTRGYGGSAYYTTGCDRMRALPGSALDSGRSASYSTGSGNGSGRGAKAALCRGFGFGISACNSTSAGNGSGYGSGTGGFARSSPGLGSRGTLKAGSGTAAAAGTAAAFGISAASGSAVMFGSVMGFSCSNIGPGGTSYSAIFRLQTGPSFAGQGGIGYY